MRIKVLRFAIAGILLLQLIAGAETKPAQISDMDWWLTEITEFDSTISHDSRPVYVRFKTEQGSVSGFSGINTFTAKLKIVADTLDISGISATKIGGEDSLMKNERELFNRLERADRYAVKDKQLELSEGEKVLLRFSPGKKR